LDLDRGRDRGRDGDEKKICKKNFHRHHDRDQDSKFSKKSSFSNISPGGVYPVGCPHRVSEKFWNKI
jgi:hypothetical protein